MLELGDLAQSLSRCVSLGHLISLSFRFLFYTMNISNFYLTGSWEHLKDTVSMQCLGTGEHSVNTWPCREPGAKSFIVDQFLVRSVGRAATMLWSFEIKEPLVKFSVHRTCWRENIAF